MSEQDTGLRHAVASDVTRDESPTRSRSRWKRSQGWEDARIIGERGEAGSSSPAKRWHSTVRSRECRRCNRYSLRGERVVRVGVWSMREKCQLIYIAPSQ